jgi:acyl carrier protein
MSPATLKSATFEQVRAVLRDTLQLGARGDRLTRATALLGSLPELDSMAVITVIAALEERFGISVDDDDISAETFATVGSLADFVDQKQAS